ncbi:hypothetical protein BFW01_g6184 [Lasiodiplodia theobromae]|nr:hypothetical protein BFW01_g6184 [Lasiodiplodia theobromae]
MTQPTQAQSFASGLESFGSIDWDAEYEELVTTEHTRPELGTVETEDTTHPEPEQLQPEGQEATNTAPLVQEPTPDHPHTLDTTFADNATPTIVASPNWTTTPEPMSSEFEDIGLYGEEATAATDTAAALAPGSFAAWEHPGWCWRESSSWCEWTATSPEVSAWALSPGINDDAEWIIGASRYGDDYAHDDIPRVASLLRRAYEYAYNVPENVCFPALARGFKAVPRRGCVAEREVFPRGAKGLKERRELGGPVYFPQPSRLSEVWSVEEEEMEKDDAEVSSEISEEWWGWFESSCGEEDEDEEGATPDTGSSASVESSNRVVVSTPITIKPVPLRPQPNIDGAEDHEAAATDSDDEDDQISTSSSDFVTIPISPPPADTAEDEDDSSSSDGIANEYEGLFALYEPTNLISQPIHTTKDEEYMAVEDQLSDSGSEEDNVSVGDAEDGIPATPSRLTLLAPQPTDAIESEEHATGSCELADRDSEDDDTSIADVTNEVEIPTTPSKPTLVIPLPPRTPVRSRDALLHDLSPSPKLTGPGLLRNMAFDDMAPQISPVLLSPALALRDTNAGKKLAPVPTLYQVFVEQHGEKTIHQATKNQQDAWKEQDMEEQHVGEESAGFWTTAAAAAVAIIGGFTVLLG